MKKTIKLLNYQLVVMLVFLTSCGFEDMEDNCSAEELTTIWNTNEEILIAYDTRYERYDYTVVSGNKLVFSYNDFISNSCLGLFEERNLFFQIEDPGEAFEFIDDEILTTNCFYRLEGGYLNGATHLFSKGTISGEKIAEDTWKIDVNIEGDSLYQNGKGEAIVFSHYFFAN